MKPINDIFIKYAKLTRLREFLYLGQFIIMPSNIYKAFIWMWV
jgi:hypothetical protein